MKKYFSTINCSIRRYPTMKQIVSYSILIAFGLLLLTACNTQKASIKGPEGNIAYKITLPKGFDTATDHCPMVILMHGIFSSKDFTPMPQIAKGLAKAGIGSVRFDFNGHGKSDGRKQDMTIEKEIADARAVWEYISSLPYASHIGLLGHSQGGVVASMTAGRLSDEGKTVSGLVLLAPGTVIKEACQGGKFFNARFDPNDPPEYIRCLGFYKLGREYLVSSQQLDIYGTSAAYRGPVLLQHGDHDGIVPLWCSERYLPTYGTNATLQIIEGENHTITCHRSKVIANTVAFFRKVFGL